MPYGNDLPFAYAGIPKKPVALLRYSPGIYLILLFCCFVQLLSGQRDSLLPLMADLPLVELSSGRELLTELGKTTFDSTHLARSGSNNVADLLSNQSSAFIKSYGLGSLATPSLRGSSSGQVAVLWNGLPIENPMLGLLDLSLLDPTYFGSVELSSGSQSTGFGSGAVAGAIRLKSEKGEVEKNGGRLTAGLGSFGQQWLKGHCYFVSQNKKMAARTTVVNRSADNDFSYFSPREDDWLKQENARLEQRGFQQQIRYTPNDATHLTLRIWGQQSEKKLPPTTTQRVSESSQGDDFLRSSLHYASRWNASSLTIRSGLFRETIDFRDPQNSLRAISHFWKAPLEGEMNWYLPGELRLTTGLSGQWLEAETAAYGAKRTQTRLAPFLALRKAWKRWHVRLSLRQETVDGDFKPVTPGAEVEWRATDHLAINASMSSSYRLPGLNDLFWTPGGRPDLLPEQGWAQELGLRWSAGEGDHHWHVKLVGHHRLLEDWIQWAPMPGSFFWSANNLTKVRSYGLECSQEQRWQLGKISLQLNAAAEYLRSENLIAIELPRMAAGEQLTYVPEWTGRTGLRIESAHSYLNMQQQYVGNRRDNSNETMEAYWLGRGVLGHRFEFGPLLFDLSASVENLWNNRQYRVIERRRMPGRHYAINFMITI
ncbi:hypothetical protein CEQ90_10195 [Lewinellaceae bacterium SD302]|nr:hypothetical protein CEQ90_10195 [Lewinellaceae bacterium SD302]